MLARGDASLTIPTHKLKLTQNGILLGCGYNLRTPTGDGLVLHQFVTNVEYRIYYYPLAGIFNARAWIPVNKLTFLVVNLL